MAIYYEAYETGELDGFYNGYRYCIYEKEKRTIAVFVLRSNMIDDVKKTAVSLIESSCAGIAVMLLILIFTSKLIVMPIAKAHRKQKEFITSASHELKTPITVIRADADILQMDNPDNEWIASEWIIMVDFFYATVLVYQYPVVSLMVLQAIVIFPVV